MNHRGPCQIFKPKECLYLTIFLMMVLLDLADSVTNGTCSNHPYLVIQMTENTRRGQAILDIPASLKEVWTFGPGTPLGMMALFEMFRNIPGSVMTLQKAIDMEDPSVLHKKGGSNEFLLILTYKDIITNVEKNFSVPLSMQPINTFAPQFNTTSIQTWAKETVPDSIHWRRKKSRVILRLREWVSDKDYLTKITRFELQRATVEEEINGLNVLQLKPVKGYIKTSKKLDFETLPKDHKFVVVKVIAYDQGGLSGTSTVTVHVEDQDDRRPYFYLPGSTREYFRGYTVTVGGNYTGPVTDQIQPAPIRVKDGDTLNATVTLAFTRDNPARLGEYISLDSRTGNVTILKGLRDFDNGRRIYLIIGATENTERRLYGKTSLVINVVDSESSSRGVKIRTIVLGMGATVTCCLVILAVGLTLFWWNRKNLESKPSIVKEERDHTSGSEKLSLQPEVIHSNGEAFQ